MNNEEKKITGYDPQTGQPIYEENNTQPATTESVITESVNETPIATEPKKNNTALVLIIIGGIVLFLIICAVLVFFVFGAAIFSSKSKNENTIVEKKGTFYGESYTIEYNYPWQESTAKLTNGESSKILDYKSGEIRFLPIGSSTLDKTATTDFSTSTGKFKLYNEFREYWGRTDNISNGTGTFYTLKDNVYYASMDYTRNKAYGKMYLIVSEENNVVLSFMTDVTIDKDSADEKVLSLLKNIKLDTIYDDEMAGYLDTMTNWNVYKSVRSGELGKKKAIEGGWRILSNSSEEYWTFKNGEFYYYKSVNDLNDNYWSGTYKKYTGKEGASKVGIEASKIDSIVAKNKDIKEKDIYTLILTPKKIISGGVDKSSTNVTGGDWQLVWILVDHGKEGIEGQQLNVKSADTSYFVKIKD